MKVWEYIVDLEEDIVVGEEDIVNLKEDIVISQWG